MRGEVGESREVRAAILIFQNSKYILGFCGLLSAYMIKIIKKSESFKGELVFISFSENREYLSCKILIKMEAATQETFSCDICLKSFENQR